MKIGLISLKAIVSTNIHDLNVFWEKFNASSLSNNLWFGISPALLTIAALTPAEHEIEFIDENYDRIDFSVNYDLVAISLMTQQSFHGYEISDQFRRKKIKVVLGGIHVSLLPEEAKKHADCIVIGEAEYVWAEVLNDLKNSKLMPVYKSDRAVNLKDSPMPRYDLFKIAKYKYINVQTSRGCPHDCDYCTASKIFGYKYRNKTIEQVIKEIEFIKKLNANPFIAFSDDNFFVNRKLSTALLERIIDLKIRWHAQSDISIGSDINLLKLMRKSGCNFVFIGLESINQESLSHLDKMDWKYKQLRNYSTYIQNIQDQGIGVMGAFILGLESDDSTSFNKTLDFVTNEDLYGASFTILTPFPGTRLREKLLLENRILNSDWSKYTGYNVNYIPNKITKEELENGIVSLYNKAYSEEVYLKKMNYFKRIQVNLIKQGVM